MVKTEFQIAFQIEGLGVTSVQVSVDPDKTTNQEMLEMGLKELIKTAKPVAIREVGQWKEPNI